jgi:hypothetical protein
VSEIAALNEEVRMVMKPTRATPIMRAEAVADVRFGLRLAFSRARRPVVPETAWIGAPSRCMRGPAITGPSTKTPMIVATVPRPIRTRAEPAPKIPAVNAATPRPTTARPAPVRAADEPDTSRATSRRAATGFTRLDRTAGTSAETTVMAVPTTKAVITVDGAITMDPPGTSRPTAPSRARRPNDIPTPAARPTAEATTPTTTDSNTTERTTWARLAPTARSMAMSRARWATTMENVL